MKSLKSKEFVCLFLHYLDRNTLVLELIDLMNTLLKKEKDLDGVGVVMCLMEIMGGVNIEIPDLNMLRLAVRDIDIYHELQKSFELKVLERLSKKYKISKPATERIYYEVYDFFKGSDDLNLFLKTLGLKTRFADLSDKDPSNYSTGFLESNTKGLHKDVAAFLEL